MEETAITVFERGGGEVIPQRVALQGSPVSQADDDAHLIRLWLHCKSRNTREAYARDLQHFLSFVGADGQLIALREIKLQWVQDWLDQLEAEGLVASSRARKLSSVKSLLSFGHRLGYLDYNVGAAVMPPKAKDRLSERILDETAVHRVLAVAEHIAASGRFTDVRNAVALRLFYASGGRVSELAALTWGDCLERITHGKTTGQLTLFGKGGKTRRVLLSPATWTVVAAHHDREREAGYGQEAEPVLRSRKSDGEGVARTLTRQQLWAIVRRLARKAGLKQAVSPHWLRHAHVSHALDRGAPAHLVQQTVGHASLTTTSRYAHARPDASSAQYLTV